MDAIKETNRILIVEDEPLIGIEIKSILKDHGYRVTSVVNSGKKAIEAAETDKPDIILMDIRLKGKMDGIETAQIIRSQFHIPVVFLTAHAENQYLEKAKLTHPYGYLIKPVQERDLKVTIEMALYVSKIDGERRQAEERFRSLVETTSDWIWEVDHNGVYTYISPKVRDILNYDPEELIGKTPSDLMPPGESNRMVDLFNKVVAPNTPFKNLENTNQQKDGDLITLESSGVPIIGDDGNLLGFRGINRDITERKKIEEDLRQTKKDSDAANQAKSEFLANMSHELRTPLNSIIGFTQVLERQLSKKISKKQLNFFSTIKSSGKHLLEMVNDILDLSKIEAGKVDIDLKPFDFGRMLKRTPRIIQSVAYNKNLQVEFNIPTDLGWLKGDETRLKQVIYNLLSNAVKFTESGKRIGIDATVEEENFVVTVWDEGEGIPDDYLEKVFIPFEQVKGSNTSKETGTGLGLSISRRLLELHQGTITVTSKIGKGSRFTITLPGRFLVEDPVVEKSVVRQSELLSGLSKDVRVLLTEDNRTNRELINITLDDCQLDFAVSGEEAVAMVSDKEYDIILMDIQLPEMDGTEAMKQIRESSRKHIPIIALTAFAMKGDKEKYLDAGFDDYVSKPIDIGLMVKKIHDNLA
jgi:PAS domain S-box-containing protein